MKKILSFLAIALILLTLSVKSVAQISHSGHIYGHWYVDLGLSVKWACYNIGAKSWSHYGDGYAWGDTIPASMDIRENNTCSTCIDDYTFYDVAAIKWGGSWRMPTGEEFQELLDNCKWERTHIGTIKGFIATSKINGNSIFFPNSEVGRYPYPCKDYWTCDAGNPPPFKSKCQAQDFNLSQLFKKPYVYYSVRSNRQFIRPVSR